MINSLMVSIEKRLHLTTSQRSKATFAGLTDLQDMKTRPDLHGKEVPML